MIRIYLDIDGVLLTKRYTQSAEFGAEFITFVTQNFDCYWLTTHCKGNATSAVKYLANFYKAYTQQQLLTVKATDWDTLKTEAIDFTTNFYWLEDAPFESELSAMRKHNAVNRLLLIDLNKPQELARVKAQMQEILNSND